MAALTLGEWRDRTLEQVHFAAKAALDTVMVQGNPRMRACVAAAATGDINQCMAQGPNIDAVRRTRTRDGRELRSRTRVRDNTGHQG